MSFVQNEQTTWTKSAEPIAQADQIVFISEQMVANEKMTMRRPRIHAESAFASSGIDVRFIENGETESKTLSQFIAPLEHDGGGSGDDDALHALAQQ